MIVIRDFSHCPKRYHGAVVALGNFDGLHIGHRAILDACITQARAIGAPAAVLTFEPHPREFFARAHSPLRILSLRDKLSRLASVPGIDAIFLARFNRTLACTTAQSFIEDILHGQLGVRHVITGYNFAFGRNREGNTDFLADAANRLGFGFTAIPPVLDDSGNPISSSAIRALLASGNMSGAATLLGKAYCISGKVRHGDARGRELGYPTANLSLERLFVPRLGIYAARASLSDGPWMDAVASIGTKPTFATTRPLLEVHCFDVNRTMYGERLRVELAEFIRDEEKFETIEALRTQMGQDCLRAKSMLHASRKSVNHG